MSDRVPKWPFRLLRWFCPPELLEEIEGDLLQRYERDIKAQPPDRLERSRGYNQANFKLLWNTLHFFRPGILVRNRVNLTHNTMIKNYFLLAFRVILHNKVYSFISLFCLSAAIAAFLFMVEHVAFENSFDKFFSNHERIYRVQHNRVVDEKVLYQKAMSFPEVGIALQEQFHEIESVTRIFPISTNIEPVFTAYAHTESRSFTEANVFLADSSFTSLFDLQFIHGDPTTALAGKDHIIINKSSALKYFGKTDVVGSVLANNLGSDLTITGVFEDLPPNSHFAFSALISWFDVYSPRSRFTWEGFYNFVQLREGTDVNQLSLRLPAFADDYMREHYANQPGNRSRFELQPLASIHLHSHLEGEIKPNGSATVNLALLIIASAAVLLALINFVNLTTSRSLQRVKEIGMRKIIGSSRRQLVTQFVCESFVIIGGAFTVAVSSVAIYHPQLNALFDSHVTLKLWQDPQYWLCAVGAVVLASIVTGFTPIFLLSRLKAYEALKGLSARGPRTRSQVMLVGVQFAISLVLIVGTYIITEQIHFMQNRDLGFKSQNLVIKMLPKPYDETDSVFLGHLAGVRNNLEALSFVNSTTVSSSIPGRKNEWRGRARLSGSDTAPILASMVRVDKDFVETFGLKVVAGRNYDSDINNGNTIIINEEAARQFGFTQPRNAIGQKMNVFREREIIGVVNSFHETGLHEPMAALVFITGEGYAKFLTVSMSGGSPVQQIDAVEQAWKQHFPDKPFEYFFLDEYFNRQYQNDQLLLRSISGFTYLAIVIACLGLLSLSAFTVQKKTNEIGIRKILGASAAHITGRLTMHFLIPVTLSAFIGLPFSYYLMNRWLTQYAYHIELTWWLFALSVAALLSIGLLTILVQTLRAAHRNPIESIRYE